MGKASAAPPTANLVHSVVTRRVKLRKSGVRVIRQFSPEITDNWRADAVYQAEGNTDMNVVVRTSPAPRGWKSAMSYNDAVSTGRACPCDAVQ